MDVDNIFFSILVTNFGVPLLGHTSFPVHQPFGDNVVMSPPLFSVSCHFSFVVSNIVQPLVHGSVLADLFSDALSGRGNV